MKLEIDLKPETGAVLLARAQLEGLSIAAMAARALDAFACQPRSDHHDGTLTAQDRVRAFDKFVEGFESSIALPDEAFSRENWYPDR